MWGAGAGAMWRAVRWCHVEGCEVAEAEAGAVGACEDWGYVLGGERVCRLSCWLGPCCWLMAAACCRPADG